jgi:Xaa-Pro dipeptidase
MDERVQRITKAMRESGFGWALLTSPDSVCYATDHEVPIELGPSPYLGGPDCAVVSAEGDVALIVVNSEEKAARASNARIVRSYEGYSHLYEAPFKENYVRTVVTLLRELAVTGKVAIEPVSFPASLREALDPLRLQFVDISRDLARVRSTKTALELQRLRHCAALTAVGQKAALAACVPGRKELEILADIRCAIEVANGRPVPLGGDLLTGTERCAQGTGLAVSLRAVERGDPIICDLGLRAAGYWGDSCNTMFVGAPTEGFARAYRAVKEAMAHAADILRPGIRASQLDAEIRSVLKKSGFAFAHHAGHGIGTAGHEFPRIVPGENATLEPEMVLAIEPGTYASDIGGVRLEWMFRVTTNGNELLSSFEHVLTS